MADITLSLGKQGRLRGTRDSNGVCRFLGVPYAQPPVGERRWTKPEPLAPNFSYERDGQPRDCTRFGDVCPQETYMLDGVAFNELQGAAYSEDCLNVNIWMPDEKPATGERWPVLAFIHGGWLQIGSPSVTPDYMHPHELLASDAAGAGAGLRAVVVSIGYRLNLFGFLAGDGVRGNFGFWDQRAALQWIQSHVHFFGGDPAAVTLFGHSAGGFSAHTLLQYELLHTDGSKPLFRSIFLCSNAIPAQRRRKLKPETTTSGKDSLTVKHLANVQLQDLYEATGVPAALSATEKLNYLRNVSAESLVDALPKLKMSNFRAVTDDDMIRADMFERFGDATFAKRFKERRYRLLCGETETEQYLYSRWLPPQSAAEMPAKLQNYYAAHVAAKLLAHPDYRQDSGEAVSDVFSRIVSDMQVRAPIRLLCRQLLGAGVPAERVMRYRMGFPAGVFHQIYPVEAGVTHGADMYMWWAGKRFGYTAQEWDAVKAWLSASLRTLVAGEDFTRGAGPKSYVLFGPDGKSDVVEDQYWDHLMSVVEAVSK